MKLGFGFHEHSEIGIALDRLQKSHSLQIFWANIFDDNCAHNSSAMFDELHEGLFASERLMPG